jgi:hypothetical protein
MNCRRLRFTELRFATTVTLCDDSPTSRHPPVSRGLPCERRGALNYLPRRSFALAHTLRCYWLLLPLAWGSSSSANAAGVTH